MRLFNIACIPADVQLVQFILKLQEFTLQIFFRHSFEFFSFHSIILFRSLWL